MTKHSGKPNPNPPQSPLIRGETLTPLNPPLSGGKLAASSESKSEGAPIPSPDKGRVREGLSFHSGKDEEGLDIDLPFIPYKKNLTTLARENRKNPTAAEKHIWQQLLRLRQFSNYKFLRQKPIGGYILDFYCAALQLAIEIDDDSHAEREEYDAERTRFLNACGIQVLRYNNDDVLQNITGVYEHLSNTIANLTSKTHEP
jgi:very-short-patch-repair endonuclease